MSMLSKGSKPGNIESRNSVKLSFTNIPGLHLNFVKCEFFLESNFPDILPLCETNLDDAIDSGNLSVTGYLSSIRKDFVFCYSYASSCSLCERRSSFCMGPISRELCRFLLMFLTGFTSLNILLFYRFFLWFLIPFHVT